MTNGVCCGLGRFSYRNEPLPTRIDPLLSHIEPAFHHLSTAASALPVVVRRKSFFTQPQLSQLLARIQPVAAPSASVCPPGKPPYPAPALLTQYMYSELRGTERVCNYNDGL
jgi:hypothetical protein